MPSDLDDEFKRLRRRVDELEAHLPGSNKTTKKQRQTLRLQGQDVRLHVEKLKGIQAIRVRAEKLDTTKPKVIIPVKANNLLVDQIVSEDRINDPRTKGKIVSVACRMALQKFRDEETRCDRKTCQHTPKHYVWVMWQDRRIISYHFSKLRRLTEDDLKPKIGRELSGRIGPWVYTAEKKTWKKDGDDKEYNQNEFADYMYFEANPYAKEDAAKLLKSIVIMTRPISKPIDEIPIDDSDFHEQ